mmetsp:Transcript_58924/g.182716  ORF Transcript_58924/g.182716 Transcript_58924/m.182716 type:complete len:235 (-) Transcript_58924:226-930(-)
MATGMSSAESPSHLRRLPALRGSLPAARRALAWTSRSWNSSASSWPSAGGTGAPGVPVTTNSSGPRAARATERPLVDTTPRGSPLRPYKRARRWDVSAAAKLWPHATASTASRALPSGAENTACSHRSAGRMSSCEPPSLPAPEARQQASAESAAMLSPERSAMRCGPPPPAAKRTSTSRCPGSAATWPRSSQARTRGPPPGGRGTPGSWCQAPRSSKGSSGSKAPSTEGLPAS